MQGEVEGAGAVGGVAERDEGEAGGSEERAVSFLWRLAVIDYLWEGGKEGERGRGREEGRERGREGEREGERVSLRKDQLM